MLKMLVTGAALAAALAFASCSTAADDTQVAGNDPHAGLATAASKAAGEVVYKQHCAACHDNPDASKSPSRDALARVSALNITNALIMGKVGSSRVDLQACKLEYSIVSPK